jgi:hypothetical protein
MIKRLIQLAVFALLANAAYRVGNEYLTFIKFRDDVRDAAMYKATNDEELVARIMDLAGEYDVPLDQQALTINRRERQVRIAGSYNKPIEVAPRYFYPWHFEWAMDATVSLVVPPYQHRPK